jgi:hypothetical protein
VLAWPQHGFHTVTETKSHGTPLRRKIMRFARSAIFLPQWRSVALAFQLRVSPCHSSNVSLAGNLFTELSMPLPAAVV